MDYGGIRMETCVGQTSNGFIQIFEHNRSVLAAVNGPKGLTGCRDLLFVDTTVSKGCKIPLSLFPSLALTECMCFTRYSLFWQV